jgi:SET domain-containing protein
MMTVKTHLAPSKIHGIGLFASEPIPKGTVI